MGRLTSDFCLTAPHAIVSAADCRSNAVPTPLRRRSGAAPTPLQRRSNAAQQRKDVARQHGMSLSTLHAQHGVNLPTLHAQNQPLILIHTQSELEQAVGSGEMVLLPQSLHAPKPLLLLTPMTHRLRRVRGEIDGRCRIDGCCCCHHCVLQPGERLVRGHLTQGTCMCWYRHPSRVTAVLTRSGGGGGKFRSSTPATTHPPLTHQPTHSSACLLLWLAHVWDACPTLETIIRLLLQTNARLGCVC